MSHRRPSGTLVPIPESLVQVERARWRFDFPAILINLIDTLPREKSLVIFVDAESSQSQFLGMLVAYLTWPHDVRIVKVRETTLESELAAAKSSSVAGMFFCSVKPPAVLTGGTHFGSAITFVSGMGLGFNP